MYWQNNSPFVHIKQVAAEKMRSVIIDNDGVVRLALLLRNAGRRPARSLARNQGLWRVGTAELDRFIEAILAGFGQQRFLRKPGSLTERVGVLLEVLPASFQELLPVLVALTEDVLDLGDCGLAFYEPAIVVHDDGLLEVAGAGSGGGWKVAGVDE